MKMLCAPNDKVCSFQINFPDTAFVENGIFAAIIRTENRTSSL